MNKCLVSVLSISSIVTAFQVNNNRIATTRYNYDKFAVMHQERVSICKSLKQSALISKRKSSSIYMASRQNSSEKQNFKIVSWAMFLGLPATSMLFPQLLQLAKSLPPNSSEQFAVVTTLFVSNRLYLYALSGIIVALAALRGATDRPKLGERITDLTEELLFRPSFENSSNDEKPTLIQSLRESEVRESLDGLSTETQALVLPVIISLFLALTVALLPFWNGSVEVGGDGEFLGFLTSFQNVAAQILPVISQTWNIGLITLFTRSELRRLGSELEFISFFDKNNQSVNESSLIIFEWAVAIGITSLAFFFQQWPAQNFVNMALAILVARAIQLDRFPSIVAALGLLTLYDATSVFLVPAVNAFDTTSSISSATSSAMGSVAIQKLTSNTFQPGLLITKIGNSFGGSLGLGDAVFPSLLANFVRRFDLAKQDDNGNRLSLFPVSMIGFFLGCFSCEFFPIISSSGIPALVFIVPFMLVSILITSTLFGELEELIQFVPGKESEIKIS